jgi:hypothetical protein
MEAGRALLGRFSQVDDGKGGLTLAPDAVALVS